jgi:hypothetical protein
MADAIGTTRGALGSTRDAELGRPKHAVTSAPAVQTALAALHGARDIPVIHSLPA